MKPSKSFEPTAVFPEFFNQFDELIPRSFMKRFEIESQIPPVNIREDENEYLIEMATPGLQIEDINIDVKDGIITISSESKKESKEVNTGYSRMEYNYRSFSRSFTLPENTNEKNIKVQNVNGELIIKVAKK